MIKYYCDRCDKEIFGGAITGTKDFANPRLHNYQVTLKVNFPRSTPKAHVDFEYVLCHECFAKVKEQIAGLGKFIREEEAK